MSSFFSSKKPFSLNNKNRFQQQFTLEQRIKKRKTLQQRYPIGNFTYLVISGLDKLQNQKNQYILIAVENSMPITFLIEYLRKTLGLGKNISLFVQISGKVRQVSRRIGQLRNQCKGQDGFLYIKLKTQNSFG